jgi:hypothetical protein
MGKWLVVLLLLVVGVVALGYYMDWFHFSTGGGKDSGKIDVNVTIDEEKIKADAEKAKEKAKDLGTQAKDKIEDIKDKKTGAPNPPNNQAQPPAPPRR